MSIKVARLLAPLWVLSTSGVRVGIQTRKSITDPWVEREGSLPIVGSEVPDTFTCEDGTTVNLKLYGLQKLLQERTSSIEEPADKLEHIKLLWEEALSQGKWSLPRKAADRKDYTYTILALSEVCGQPFAAVKKSFDAYPQATKEQFVTTYKEQAEALRKAAEAPVDLTTLLNP